MRGNTENSDVASFLTFPQRLLFGRLGRRRLWCRRYLDLLLVSVFNLEHFDIENQLFASEGMVEIEHDRILLHLIHLSEDRLASRALSRQLRPPFACPFWYPVLVDFLLPFRINPSVPFLRWDLDPLAITNLEPGELFLQTGNDLMRPLGKDQRVFTNVGVNFALIF